jgi:hypothetical protein
LRDARPQRASLWPWSVAFDAAISEVATLAPLAPTGPCLHTARFALPSPLYKEPRRQALLAFQHVRTQHSLAALPLRRRRTRQPPAWPLHMAAFALNRGLSAGRTPRRTARHVLGSRPSHALAHAPVRPATLQPHKAHKAVCAEPLLRVRSAAAIIRTHGQPLRPLWRRFSISSPLGALSLRCGLPPDRVYTQCTRSDRAHVRLGGGSRSRPLPHSRRSASGGTRRAWRSIGDARVAER